MARVTVEDCLENMDNRFQLVMVASKRARQLANGSDARLEWENDKPTVMALRERLQGRGQDSEDIIERRMRDAVSESSHYDESDYLVINDDFTAALDELGQLIVNQRLKTTRQTALHKKMISDLLA